MKSILSLIPVSLFVFTGCDALLADVETLTCTWVPYQAGNCSDPALVEKVTSVLTDGAVADKIECNGVAFNPNFTKFVNVRYSASRLQDDACFARADVFGLNTSGGFVQSSASELNGRSEEASETCSVLSLHGPALETTTSVENGVVTVESPFCVSALGTACTMSVAANCTGDVDKF